MNIKIKPDKVAENLKAMRLAAGMTQDTARAAIGAKSVATISHYENGVRQVSVVMLIKLAKVYGFEIELRIK